MYYPIKYTASIPKIEQDQYNAMIHEMNLLEEKHSITEQTLRQTKINQPTNTFVLVKLYFENIDRIANLKEEISAFTFSIKLDLNMKALEKLATW